MVKDSWKILNNTYNRFEIIIMDDGSKDNSPKICKNLANWNTKIRIISNKTNLGKTKTIIKGIKMARPGIISFIDADYQYDSSDLPQLIDQLMGGKDISVGNRYLENSRKDSLKRKIASRIFNLFNRIMFRIMISDVNCGLKAFRSEVFDQIKIDYTSARWFIDTEILAKAYRKKMKIIQIPIRHYNRRGGDSKVDIFKLTIETLYYSILLKKDFLFGGNKDA